MTGTKVCNACKKEVPSDTNICGYCGTLLVGLLPAQTTTKVPDEPAPSPLGDQLVKMTELYDDVLAFLITGQLQPILVQGEQKVLLGRSGYLTDPQPTIDFTTYNGVGLGVSRQHAVISRPGDRYVIQDLGSTNGTWVNEIKLVKDKFHELNSGDVIRLGQLTFYVYFKLPEKAEVKVETVHLKSRQPGTTALQLTLPTLEQGVIPFLRALSSLQTICNDLLLRAPAEMGIDAIVVDVPNGQINLQLRGAADAIKLARERLGARQHEDVLQMVTAAPGEPANGTLTDGPATQRVADYLKKLAPDFTEERLRLYMDRFRPHLDALAANQLQMIDPSPPGSRLS